MSLPLTSIPLLLGSSTFVGRGGNYLFSRLNDKNKEYLTLAANAINIFITGATILTLGGTGTVPIASCVLFVGVRTYTFINCKISKNTNKYPKAQKLFLLSSAVSNAIMVTGGVMAIALLPYTPFSILTSVCTVDRLHSIYQTAKSYSKTY